MKKRVSSFGDDRGAILIHVALGLLVLVAFTTFVADYGLLWVSRRQAQNAADAGALAGAVALAYDNSSKTVTGPAQESAFAATQRNLVWGQAPSVIKGVVNGQGPDITFPTCPDGSGTCIRVDVYRNLARGNQLPVFFGNLVGLTSQGIQATATAEVEYGNATDCLKPWAVIDKWEEHWPAPDPVPWTNSWTITSKYDRYDKQGNRDPAVTRPDIYTPPRSPSTPPTNADFGSGFHPYDVDGNYVDYGLKLTLKQGNAQTDSDYATGWFSALALTDSTGGKDYLNNIEHCVGTTYTVGQVIETEPGDKVGPTSQGVEKDVNSLINQDPTAVWDLSMNGGKGGVNSPFPVSPRIVAIPLVNPDEMILINKSGRTTVPISNIMGFFIDSYSAKGVSGYLMTMPGKFVAGGGPTGPGGFLKAVILVR